MFRRIVTAAVLAAIAGVTVAQAQTVAQIGGPAELPPAGFKGQMYVDSRGCVFLRAGLSGRTSWVPRVSSNRKALCGYPPTLQAMAKPVQVQEPVAVAQAPAVPQPAPIRSAGKPIDTVASLKTPPALRVAPPAAVVSAESSYYGRALPAPVAQPQAQPRAVVMNTALPRVADPVFLPAQIRSAQIGPGQIGCFASAPVPKIVALSNGGTAVLCTKGDGTLNGVRAPIYATVAMGEGARVGAGLYPAVGQPTRRAAPAVRAQPMGVPVVRYASAPPPASALTEVVVPKGYKIAWKDDRLNPYRGLGTVSGQVAQDQVWTREIPANLVVAQPVPGQRVVVVSSKNQRPVLQVSTHSEPKAVVRKPAVTGGRLYVQVGTFGVPANAESAKARLRAAGLPVGTARLSKGGKPLQLVMAGPFGDAAQAQAALRAARSAGFGDAFLR